MSYWKLKKSRVPGKIPTLNEIDLDTIVLNQADAIAYVVKLLAGGEKIVVPLAGGGVTELQMSGTIIQYKYPGDEDWSNLVDISDVFPAKALYSDINTGNDNNKYVTPNAIALSNVWRKEKGYQIWLLPEKDAALAGADRFLFERDQTGMKTKITYDQLLAELLDYFDDMVVTELQMSGTIIQYKYPGDEDWSNLVDISDVFPAKALYSDINTGNDNNKYVTPYAIALSNVWRKEKGYQILLLQEKDAALAGADRFMFERDQTGMKTKITYDQLLAELLDYFGDIFISALIDDSTPQLSGDLNAGGNMIYNIGKFQHSYHPINVVSTTNFIDLRFNFVVINLNDNATINEGYFPEKQGVSYIHIYQHASNNYELHLFDSLWLGPTPDYSASAGKVGIVECHNFFKSYTSGATPTTRFKFIQWVTL